MKFYNVRFPPVYLTSGLRWKSEQAQIQQEVSEAHITGLLAGGPPAVFDYTFEFSEVMSFESIMRLSLEEKASLLTRANRFIHKIPENSRL